MVASALKASCPDSFRASTSLLNQDAVVDGRVKPGHDGGVYAAGA